jgi:voltage-dependent potassium channel beta subunit
MEMEYRFLGNSGLRVSSLSFGAWVTFGQQIGEETATECMKEAFDAGVNFFDNAEVYAAGEAETLMGRILRKQGWSRSELVVSTKIFWGGRGVNERGLSRKHVREGTEAALRRLQLDYVDLVFCHRPDPSTPLEETVWAMSQLVQEGKALYWGTSEWNAADIASAYEIARRERLVPPTMEQPQYNMFHRDRVEAEYAPLYRRYGLGTTIWSPLASGLLTGKYVEGDPGNTRASLSGYEWLRDQLTGEAASARLEKVQALRPVAEDLGASLAQLALAWCLRNPHVSSVITGASRAEQVRENMKALALVPKLGEDVMAGIEQVLGNRPEGERDWRGM